MAIPSADIARLGRLNAASSLYYYRARYYDPAPGRFLNEDPIRFNGGLNFYAYVYNTPTRLIDPSGSYAKLNPKSRCAKVFAKVFSPGSCVEDFVNDFNAAASKIPIYTVPSAQSPASSLTQNEVSGNGDQTPLGSPFFGFMNPATAYTITNGRPVVVLGPNYFRQPLDQRIATLLHEELHALTLLDDAAIFDAFSKYGLPDASFIHDSTHPTKELSDWIRNGCPPKP